MRVLTDARSTVYDVVVIGAGVVGTAVARVLSHHELSVAMLDAGPDVGAGTSKANTAILHTGFDATPGSLESRLVARGYELLREYAPSVGIAVEETGAVLVAWSDEQATRLPGLAARARENGYASAELLDVAEVRELEPRLGDGVTGGMLVPDEHIIDPWSTPIAFAREAIANRAEWLPNRHVTKIEVGAEVTGVETATGEVIRTRYVVNAAGLSSDAIHELVGLGGFTVRPRRGELIVFDKFARGLVHHTILPVPTAHSKGVLVAPTVFGNVMLGPTAEDVDDKTATGTTRKGIDDLLAKGRTILPALLDEEVTAIYAGVRAATEHSDYQVTDEPDLRYVCLGGIRSTGLTSSMALAEEALDRLRLGGLEARLKPADRRAVVKVANLGEAVVRPFEIGGSGPIVCHCERVTRDEIAGACTTTPAATTLDGIRRRTRALTGRCQGFYCTAEVCSVAAEVTGRSMSDWLGGS
jgi:glycerol-3-phosphate dehydrogenase